MYTIVYNRKGVDAFMKKDKIFRKREKELNKLELAARKEAIKNLGLLSNAVKKLAKGRGVSFATRFLGIVDEYVKDQGKKFKAKPKKKKVSKQKRIR